MWSEELANTSVTLITCLSSQHVSGIQLVCSILFAMHCPVHSADLDQRSSLALQCATYTHT